MVAMNRIISPLPNPLPLPLAGEGVNVGSARPNQLTMRGKTF
jgi:hypothetical protein